MEPYQLALQFYGLKEIAGKEHEKEILEFFKTTGYDIDSDETSWCSAFVNYCNIMTQKEHSGSLTARSWLKEGVPVKEPKLGDVVVLWRVSPNSWQGHVGYFINKIGDQIFILGGNQDNQVNIKPYQESRLLGYRRI